MILNQQEQNKTKKYAQNFCSYSMALYLGLSCNSSYIRKTYKRTGSISIFVYFAYEYSIVPILFVSMTYFNSD